MAYPPRRPSGSIEQAEALFKAATTKSDDQVQNPKRNAIPVGRELVSIRLDRDVLEHYQDEGAGWQDRINVALRVASGIDQD